MKLVTNVVKSFQVAKIFRENTDRINSIDFTSDGKSLISSSDDDSIVIYDCERGTHKRTLHSKKYGADLVRFTHAENSAVHSSTKVDDTIRYLSLHDNKYIRYFTGHAGRVVSISMSPTDDTFISGSLDKTIRLWDLRSPNCQGFLTQSGRPVASFDPEGLIFAVGIDAEMVKLYDLRSFDKVGGKKPLQETAVKPTQQNLNNGPFNTFKLPKSKEYDWTGMKFSPDGKMILLSTNNSIAHLLDAYHGVHLRTLTGFTNTKGIPLEAAFSPDSQFVFSGSTDGNIHVWNSESGNKCAVLNCNYSGPINCVQFNPKLMMLVSACTNMAFWLPSFSEEDCL